MSDSLTLKFEGASTAEANAWAAELAEMLEHVAPDVDVSRQRDDADAMDMGATLVLVLGAPAVVALAKGLADWLRKRQTATISVYDANGNKVIEGTNLTSGDARALADRISLAVRP